MMNKQNEYYVDDIISSGELKNYVIANRVMGDVKAAIDTTKINCQKYISNTKSCDKVSSIHRLI